MPDRRKHRGQHPQDANLFAPDQLSRLRAAVADLAWLAGRGYAEVSSLKLVGDRYELTTRQRMAVRRSACSDQARAARAASMADANQCRNQPIAIDGYNLLITIESALSGGLVLIGRDGCLRDLAGIHGTYRKVAETAGAVRLITEEVAKLEPRSVTWYLDRPVSNSGRLRKLMLDVFQEEPDRTSDARPWKVEIEDSPDSVLKEYDGVVATSDSVILDSCGRWLNLAAHIVTRRIPTAWTVDLRSQP